MLSALSLKQFLSKLPEECSFQTRANKFTLEQEDVGTHMETWYFGIGA